MAVVDSDTGRMPAEVLTPVRIALIGLVVVVIAFAAYWFLIRTTYDPVLRALPPEDAADVVKVLDAKKIPYRLADSGTTILVPSEQADKARLELVASELPMRGQVGFELFNQSDMGLTEFAQKINYQRALQGELARTILMLDGIHSVSGHGIAAIDAALIDYPEDPRLYFLKGSLLIGLKHFVEAHDALSRAVEIAPDFALARFQLGFFELTSGEAEAALETWRPLRMLPPGHWMLSFVIGLEHLIADRFAECIASLRQGIAANTENLPLNNDMRLIIEKCEELLAANTSNQTASTESEISATSLLLRTTGADETKQ